MIDERGVNVLIEIDGGVYVGKCAIYYCCRR